MNPSAPDLPANAGLRRRLEPLNRRPDLPRLATPDQVAQPHYTLGTHPDLLARLWEEMQAALPTDCRAVFFGLPVLMHPDTGVVFGLAMGTHTYALRLPPREHAAALQAGADRIRHYPGNAPSIDLADIGPEWLFCRWYPDERAWCLAAYGHAGRGAGD